MEKQNLFKKNSKVLLSIIVIFIYILFPTLTSSIIGLFGNVSKIVQIVYNIIVYLALISSLIYIYRDTIKSDLLDIKEKFKNYIPIILKNTLLVIILVFIINASLLFLFDVQTASENDQALFELFKETPMAVLFLTIFYYPIVEGIVFRKTVKDVVKNKYPFIILCSLFYCFFNIAYNTISIENIINSTYYFAIMFVLAKVYYKTDNFLVSVMVLMLYNSFASLMLLQ